MRIRTVPFKSGLQVDDVIELVAKVLEENTASILRIGC
jgi:hypothetical protein